MKTSSPITSYLALAILLVLSIQLASAEIIVTRYDHDAFFDSPQQLTRVCGCGMTTDYFTLQNIGDFDANFLFTLDASADWITMQRYQQFLEAGETTRVAVTLAPPCGNEDAEQYTIYATSQYGRFRAVERDVYSTTCEAIGFALEQDPIEVLPCQPTLFTLHLHNVAPYEETFSVRAEPWQDVSLSRSSVTLTPGERTDITGTVQYPCDQYGDRDVRFTVKAENTGVESVKDATVRIRPDYAFAVDLGDAEPICAEETTTREVRITNIADTPNSYRARLSGSSFATLSESEFDLQPQMSKTLRISMQPEESDAGMQDFLLIVESANGQTYREFPITLDINDCHELDLSIHPAENTLCAGTSDATVRVANRGMQAETISLNSGGEIFSVLSRSIVTLRPGEAADITMEIGVPDRDEDWRITVDATLPSGVAEHREMLVHSVSNAACTEVEPLQTELEVFSDVQAVPFILRHDGVEAATFALHTEGELFDLDRDEVFLAPGEEATILFLARDLSALDEGEYVQQFWATSDRATYRDDFEIELHHRGFLDMLAARLGRDGGSTDWCLVAQIVLLILIAVAIVLLVLILTGVVGSGAITGFMERHEEVVVIVAGILIVLAVLLAIFSAVGVESPVVYEDAFLGTNYSALFHETPQDETYRLNLDQYFYDPDGGSLSFSDNQPDNLDIRYDGTSAIISPHRGYSGEERVVFTATDESGASVSSPIMTVRVVGREPTTLMDYVTMYCAMVSWLLFALLVMLVTVCLLLIRPGPADELPSDLYFEGSRPLQPYAVEAAPVERGYSGTPQVTGDLVAGDKVTIVNQNVEEQLFVASTNGKRFHKIDSPYARRIPKENRVVFHSKEEAIKAGYTPSKL